MSYDFPMLKIRSKSVIFVFEFERVMIQNPLVLTGEGNEKAARTPVLQNFLDYARSINDVGIPLIAVIGHHASKMKPIVDKILKKARIFFMEINYLPENLEEDRESYEQFKQSKLEKMTSEFEMIYFFDSDKAFITKMESSIQNREQFELFTVQQ